MSDTAAPRRLREAADDRALITLGWLIRLRWGAVVGQVVTIGVAEALFGGLLLGRLLGLVALLAISNVVVGVAQGRLLSPRRVCGAALTLDILLLTGQLQASGGASNPFSVLYLVYITLAAVVLGARWTWSLASLSVGCYGILFVTTPPLEHGAHGPTGLGMHLQGMWVAFTVAAVLTAYFVVKLSTALEAREAAMADMWERAARQERLASVTTLAAGAAHELGTPLATIAVASRELERSVRSLPEAYARGLVEDATLIRSELDRCRGILDRLAAHSGQGPGEAPVTVRAEDLVAEIRARVPSVYRPRLRVSSEPPATEMTVPKGALLQVAQSLLQNAFEAGEGAVSLSLDSSGGRLRLRVEDEGPGMSAEVLARVGEPYFSTKEPGRGLGLGLFIARTLSEQMGGKLTIESTLARGTTATVEIGGSGS